MMTNISLPNRITLYQLLFHPAVQQLKSFRHHKNTSIYEHSIHVMNTACHIAYFFRFNDTAVKNIIVGSLLHDMYMYDYHHARIRSNGIHAWTHPSTALKNATQYFTLNTKQKNIIESHMYPITLRHPPKCKEAWVVMLSDKYCAIKEYFTKNY